MSQINTISEFLLQAGTDYRVFDMARGIRPLSSQTFLDIENGSQAAPFPRQQHAWFGILFFNKQLSKELYIWFVKLPLDEQGLVMNAGRQQFLHIVVEALGKSLDKQDNPNNQLPENPFTFVPSQQQLASFNSICRTTLATPLSEHLDLAKQYICTPTMQDWRLVPMQGIADFCALITETTDNTQAKLKQQLMQQFLHLAPQVQEAICSALENHQVDEPLSLVLINWYQTTPNDPQIMQAVLRALCQSQAKTEVKNLLHTLLENANQTQFQEPLVMLIAARHWQYLLDKTFLVSYLDLLAKQEFGLFSGLFSDLVQIPSLRETMLGMLRWPDKSPQLTQAIGQLFGQKAP
ncbi:DUF3549 family protein [Paraglaciecola aestuariivivens]